MNMNLIILHRYLKQLFTIQKNVYYEFARKIEAVLMHSNRA